MPEVVRAGAEEQEEEEEEEEGGVLTLRSRGLHSRAPAILAEGEPMGELITAEEVEPLKLTWWGRMMLRFRESRSAWTFLSS